MKLSTLRLRIPLLLQNEDLTAGWIVNSSAGINY